MKKTSMPKTRSKAAEIVPAAPDAAHYVLQLYIAGTSSRCIRAIANIRTICEQYLDGRYDLEVVDISQHPALAEEEQIIAAPTLVKKLPLPVRRFIGDLSATERILIGLDLRELADKAAHAAGGGLL